MSKSAIKNSQTLKQLNSRKAKLEVDIEQMRVSEKEIKDKLKKASEQMGKINLEITNATGTEPIVTEHALIRYMERVMEVDLDIVRNKILTEDLSAKIIALGSGKYSIQEKYFAVVKGMSVISIV